MKLNKVFFLIDQPGFPSELLSKCCAPHRWNSCSHEGCYLLSRRDRRYCFHNYNS